ncbi:DUF433 domain-containing protein [Acidicapsa acidisoli]|uniref:DUF433 domain-containing protein n=1 Tax=Acidicapsa acidisoli TaxID=1615681 RepID=UPI0021E0F5D1|nr:DUF433 domain-containing protein [Acidicapsa acidisoli]
MNDAVYTPAQASAVADLPLKAVHKLIDGRLIRPRRRRVGRETQRFLSQNQLVYLRLEAEGVKLLPLATRREVAKAVANSPEIDMVHLSEGSAVTIQVKHVRQEIEQQLMRLTKAQQMTTSDPEILRGTPVYRGTRIPVELIAEMLADGASVEEILEGYPALDRTKVELATLYVRAFPRRGRPSQRPWTAAKKPAGALLRAKALAE